MSITRPKVLSKETASESDEICSIDWLLLHEIGEIKSEQMYWASMYWTRRVSKPLHFNDHRYRAAFMEEKKMFLRPDPQSANTSKSIYSKSRFDRKIQWEYIFSWVTHSYMSIYGCSWINCHHHISFKSLRCSATNWICDAKCYWLSEWTWSEISSSIRRL